jgi:hypothetical protein
LPVRIESACEPGPNMFWNIVRRLVEPRVNAARGAYVLCGLMIAGLISLGASEGENVSTMWHFVLLLTLCIVQLWRPTLLVWLVIVVAFGGYAVTILVYPVVLTLRERAVFVLLGVIPSIALLWFRPTRQ